MINRALTCENGGYRLASVIQFVALAVEVAIAVVVVVAINRHH